MPWVVATPSSAEYARRPMPGKLYGNAGSNTRALQSFLDLLSCADGMWMPAGNVLSAIGDIKKRVHLSRTGDEAVDLHRDFARNTQRSRYMLASGPLTISRSVSIG